MLVAIGAGIAVLTGLGAGIGIGLATSKAVGRYRKTSQRLSQKISKNLILGCAPCRGNSYLWIYHRSSDYPDAEIISSS